MLSWYNHRQAKREFINAVKLNSFSEPKLLVFFFLSSNWSNNICFIHWSS